MAEVRFWQSGDLPTLRWFAAQNAWQILPADDRQQASVGDVATLAEQNLLRVLSAPGGTAIVAQDRDRIVGYLLIAIQQDDKTGTHNGYMADIYIEPEYRRHGIGAQFHQLGEQYLTRLGVRRATLWSHAHNPLGQKSAERRGYRLQGVMMSRALH